MRKNILIPLLALVLLSSSALATDTRVLTMGNNNMVLLDEANITIFPSRVYEYPNLAIGQFNNNDFQEFGVHWKFGKDNPWVLATYFAKYQIGLPMGYYNNAPFGYFTSGLGTTNKRMDVYYGRPNIIANHNFGFHFGYTRASYEYDDTTGTSNYKEKLHNYEFGVGLTEASGKYDIAAYVALGGWTDEGLDTTYPGGVPTITAVEQSKPDGYLELGADFRRFSQIDPEWTAIFHGSLFYSKHGEKDNGADGDWATKADLVTKDTWFSFDAGVGANWTPATNVLVVGDVGLAFSKIKRELSWTVNYSDPAGSQDMSYTDWVVPYWSIGFDADVFKWMDVRMGATSWWLVEKHEVTDVYTEKGKGALNDTYLGFGFHWNRLHVDTQTDPDLFLRGFDFISGNGGGDMNLQLSVLYELM